MRQVGDNLRAYNNVERIYMTFILLVRHSLLPAQLISHSCIYPQGAYIPWHALLLSSDLT